MSAFVIQACYMKNMSVVIMDRYQHLLSLVRTTLQEILPINLIDFVINSYVSFISNVRYCCRDENNSILEDTWDLSLDGKTFETTMVCIHNTIFISCPK